MIHHDTYNTEDHRLYWCHDYKGLYEGHSNHPCSASSNRALNILNEAGLGEIEPVNREGGWKLMEDGWRLLKFQ